MRGVIRPTDYRLDVDDGRSASELEGFEVWTLSKQGEEVRHAKLAGGRKILQCQLAELGLGYGIEHRGMDLAESETQKRRI